AFSAPVRRTKQRRLGSSVLAMYGEGLIPATKQTHRQLYDYKSQADIYVHAVYLAAYFLFAIPDRSPSSCRRSNRLIAPVRRSCSRGGRRWIESPRRGDGPTR